MLPQKVACDMTLIGSDRFQISVVNQSAVQDTVLVDRYDPIRISCNL